MPRNPDDDDRDDYEVGYGKPPRHSQFPPGVSGNKGRRKRPETQAETIARVRDERVMVNGKPMTKFEMMIHQVFNQTIRSGKPRDLKALLELLDKHGAIPEADRWAEVQAGADSVMEKIMTIFDRTYDIDPADTAELKRLSGEEAAHVMACSHCAPHLKAQWKKEERKALSERHGKTGLHTQVEQYFAGKSSG
jgi:hypothetical protein